MDDRALAAALDDCRILLCYGLLGEVMARLRPVGLDYMGAQADWLRALGLPVQVVDVPTAAPVACNAARIAEVMAADDRPALLIAHSKGGLEALAALLRPGVAERCRGFIAIQSPFFGSPVADAICARAALHRAAHHTLRALGIGDGAALRDLTTATRASWMAAHADAIAALVRSLPVIAVASELGRCQDLHDHVYQPLSRWMRQRGAGPNDGLVPVASAQLPGARQVLLTAGHRSLVAEGGGGDPVGVLRDLLWQMVYAGQAAP
jgi:pimeloyl-ACP methyl ester carboxylesterase